MCVEEVVPLLWGHVRGPHSDTEVCISGAVLLGVLGGADNWWADRK